jgi:hypothetical protein
VEIKLLRRRHGRGGTRAHGSVHEHAVGRGTHRAILGSSSAVYRPRVILGCLCPPLTRRIVSRKSAAAEPDTRTDCLDWPSGGSDPLIGRLLLSTSKCGKLRWLGKGVFKGSSKPGTENDAEGVGRGLICRQCRCRGQRWSFHCRERRSPGLARRRRVVGREATTICIWRHLDHDQIVAGHAMRC